MSYRPFVACMIFSSVSGCILSSSATTEDVFTTDLPIPASDSVPGPVGAVFADYRNDNAAYTPTETLQTGEATYEGRFAFGFTGGTVQTVAGDMRLAMNFDAATLNGIMDNISVYETDGSFQDSAGHFLTVSGDAAGNRIHADIRGHFHVDNETWEVTAHTHGALGGRNGEVALGDIDGEVALGDISNTEGIAGFYVLDRQP